METKLPPLDGTERVRLKLGYTARREAWSYAAPHGIWRELTSPLHCDGNHYPRYPKRDTPALGCKLRLHETPSRIIFSGLGMNMHTPLPNMLYPIGFRDI